MNIIKYGKIIKAWYSWTARFFMLLDHAEMCIFPKVSDPPLPCAFPSPTLPLFFDKFAIALRISDVSKKNKDNTTNVCILFVMKLPAQYYRPTTFAKMFIALSEKLHKLKTIIFIRFRLI